MLPCAMSIAHCYGCQGKLWCPQYCNKLQSVLCIRLAACVQQAIGTLTGLQAGCAHAAADERTCRAATVLMRGAIELKLKYHCQCGR